MRFFGTFSGAAQKKGQLLSVQRNVIQRNVIHLSLADPLNTNRILQKPGRSDDVTESIKASALSEGLLKRPRLLKY